MDTYLHRLRARLGALRHLPPVTPLPQSSTPEEQTALTALVRLSARVDPLGWLQEEHGSLAARITLDERLGDAKRVVGSELQRPMQFLADFQAIVNNAKERVWVQTMMFTCGHAPGLIAHALRRAALRGVDTKVYVDYYTFLVQGALPAWMPMLHKDDREYRSTIRNSTTAMYLDLEKAGVNLTYTNPPRNIERIFPYKNRNHVKAVIVDDNLYIGGLNFEDALFNQADFMVKMNNQAVVSAVANQFGQVNGNRPCKDYVINCDKDNRLLFDRGAPRTSVILDEAVHATRASNNQVTLISMHPPSGPLLDAIVDKAKHGVPSTIILSPKDDKYITQYPYKLSYKMFLAKIGKFPNIALVHSTEYVHAKVLLLDHQQAFLGSHNLTNFGVLLGTQEMTLHTKDPHIVRQLSEFSNELTRKP